MRVQVVRWPVYGLLLVAVVLAGCAGTVAPTPTPAPPASRSTPLPTTAPAATQPAASPTTAAATKPAASPAATIAAASPTAAPTVATPAASPTAVATATQPAPSPTTAAAKPAPTATPTPAPAPSPTLAPTATVPAPSPTTAPPATKPAPTKPSAGGDPSQGAQLFVSQGCQGCHMVGGQGGQIGPNLSMIGAEAANRKPGMDAAAYIRESIMQPNAFVVQGYQPGIMPQNYADVLNQNQIADLVAYLLQQR